jgi:hypothetical protein
MKQETKPKARNPKQNNRHAYGNGNGKIGKKADRIRRAAERGET